MKLIEYSTGGVIFHRIEYSTRLKLHAQDHMPFICNLRCKYEKIFSQMDLRVKGVLKCGHTTPYEKPTAHVPITLFTIYKKATKNVKTY